MDFILSQNNLYIIIIALISGAMLLWPVILKSRGGSSSVQITEAIELANRKQAIFIDVRKPEEFKTGSIPQARNLPSDEIEAKLSSLPKNKPIIVVCDQGRESARVAAMLRKQGFGDTVSLAGGLRAWSKEGLPLAKKD
ncbi:MAG: rhodanese-like domain-containing protein [Candidimonas sp.]|nr:MAG: rhodanese-like domain-containing protein [Candidimonas sp.]